MRWREYLLLNASSQLEIRRRPVTEIWGQKSRGSDVSLTARRWEEDSDVLLSVEACTQQEITRAAGVPQPVATNDIV